MFAANPIALTHWRLFRRGAMMPFLLLFGGGAILAVISGMLGMTRDDATADVARTLLGWQLIALVAIPPIFAGTTLSRARQSGTLATDRNSPVRPRQLLLGYLSSALAPATAVGVPGLAGMVLLAAMSGDEARIGWFGAQALAATTGVLLALCTTVGLLVAQKSRAAIAAGGALIFMAFTMGFNSEAVTGLLLPSSVIAEVGFGRFGVADDQTAQLMGFAWLTQLTIAGFAWLAGVRALDPRRDRRAMRLPWIGLVAALWAIQLGLVVTSVGGAHAEEVAASMLPITLVLLLGASVESSAWSRALRSEGHTRGVSLVPYALGLAAAGAVGLLALMPYDWSAFSTVSEGTVLGSSIVLVAVAALADAGVLLAARTRNLLFAALAFALGLVPFMISVMSGDESLLLLSPIVALPALMFDARSWDGDTTLALVTSTMFVVIAFGIRHHAVSQARSAPKRVVGER